MAGREEIKFTSERRTFFSKKVSQQEEGKQEDKPHPPTVVIAPPPIITTGNQNKNMVEAHTPIIQSVNQQAPQPYQPQSADRRPLFKNSSLVTGNVPLPQNAPLVQNAPTSQTQIVTQPVVQREKLPDEVPLVFAPAKYKIVNPTLKFEYRRTQIELKLGHIDQEEGEVMTVFVGPDYKESKEVAKLTLLCQYDVAKCITECKPRSGKVMPLTSKSFDRFSGLFVVYLDERINRSDLVDALSNLFKQVDENEVEQICIPVPKSKVFSGSADELANCIIDEAMTFLSNRSRDNKPTQISWLQFITDQPQMFSELTRVYAQAVEKVGANQNLIVVRTN